MLKPYDDAATIRDNGSSAPVLAWLGDPMDLQFLQIQGSGRIQLEDGRQLRIGYGDQNGHPYKPVGRWLVEQGLVPKEEISMKRIRDWAEANPQRVSELLASNPSFVFFSLRPDSDEGPRGSLNVPLTDGYSVAIDRKVIPLGSLMWLSTTRPDDGSAVVRPVAAQDTGGAIVGEVRADLFWGTGDAAGELAGHMKQPGGSGCYGPGCAAARLLKTSGRCLRTRPGRLANATPASARHRRPASTAPGALAAATIQTMNDAAESSVMIAAPAGPPRLAAAARPPTPLVRATPGRRSRGSLPRQKAISRRASTPLIPPFRQLPILIVVRGNLYLILNTHETYKNTHSETLRKPNARWKCNA